MFARFNLLLHLVYLFMCLVDASLGTGETNIIDAEKLTRRKTNQETVAVKLVKLEGGQTTLGKKRQEEEGPETVVGALAQASGNFLTDILPIDTFETFGTFFGSLSKPLDKFVDKGLGLNVLKNAQQMASAPGTPVNTLSSGVAQNARVPSTAAFTSVAQPSSIAGGVRPAQPTSNAVQSATFSPAAIEDLKNKLFPSTQKPAESVTEEEDGDDEDYEDLDNRNRRISGARPVLKSPNKFPSTILK